MTSSLPDATLRQATADWLALPATAADPRLAVLRLSGPDALTFLQGQATADIREITPGTSRLGALLNLKGRIVVAFRALAVDDGYLLVVPADQLAPLQARLGKYAVFSKVTLTAADLPVTGLAGRDIAARLADAGLHVPAAADAVSRLPEGWLVRLPGADRFWLLGSATLTGITWPDDGQREAAYAAWQVRSLMAGEYLPPAAASEQHQPQELDYHTLQGVSYQKGCYLGQEIVARLYFRGNLKYRLQWLQGDWPVAVAPQPGDTLFSGDDKVGEVISVVWPDARQVGVLGLVRQDSDGAALVGEQGPVSLTALPFTR